MFCLILLITTNALSNECHCAISPNKVSLPAWAPGLPQPQIRHIKDTDKWEPGSAGQGSAPHLSHNCSLASFVIVFGGLMAVAWKEVRVSLLLRGCTIGSIGSRQSWEYLGGGGNGPVCTWCWASLTRQLDKFPRHTRILSRIKLKDQEVSQALLLCFRVYLR